MKNYLKHIILVLFLVVPIATIYSCKSYKSSVSHKFEDFDEFAEKFYSDSVFQFSRIVFNLQGSESYIDQKNADIKEEWSKDDLTSMIPGIDSYSDGYEVKLIKSLNIVKEIIFMPQTGYYEVRTFVLMQKKWYLKTYYINSY